MTSTFFFFRMKEEEYNLHHWNCFKCIINSSSDAKPWRVRGETKSCDMSLTTFIFSTVSVQLRYQHRLVINHHIYTYLIDNTTQQPRTWHNHSSKRNKRGRIHAYRAVATQSHPRGSHNSNKSMPVSCWQSLHACFACPPLAEPLPWQKWSVQLHTALVCSPPDGVKYCHVKINAVVFNNS